jgi:hypothetical protein
MIHPGRIMVLDDLIPFDQSLLRFIEKENTVEGNTPKIVAALIIEIGSLKPDRIEEDYDGKGPHLIYEAPDGFWAVRIPDPDTRCFVLADAHGNNLAALLGVRDISSDIVNDPEHRIAVIQ